MSPLMIPGSAGINWHRAVLSLSKFTAFVSRLTTSGCSGPQLFRGGRLLLRKIGPMAVTSS